MKYAVEMPLDKYSEIPAARVCRSPVEAFYFKILFFEQWRRHALFFSGKAEEEDRGLIIASVGVSSWQKREGRKEGGRHLISL